MGFGIHKKQYLALVNSLNYDIFKLCITLNAIKIYPALFTKCGLYLFFILKTFSRSCLLNDMNNLCITSYLPIQHIHQARNQLLAWGHWIFEIYLVDVGNVETDAFGVWSFIEDEGENGLVHVHGIPYLAYDIDWGVGVLRTDEDNGFRHLYCIYDKLLVIRTAIDSLFVNPILNAVLL